MDCEEKFVGVDAAVNGTTWFMVTSEPSVPVLTSRPVEEPAVATGGAVALLEAEDVVADNESVHEDITLNDAFDAEDLGVGGGKFDAEVELIELEDGTLELLGEARVAEVACVLAPVFLWTVNNLAFCVAFTSVPSVP